MLRRHHGQWPNKKDEYSSRDLSALEFKAVNTRTSFFSSKARKNEWLMEHEGKASSSMGKGFNYILNKDIRPWFLSSDKLSIFLDEWNFFCLLFYDNHDEDEP